MNILVDDLPEAIEIDGTAYEINTDFRNCLRIMMAFEDAELTEYEKQLVMLQLLYKELPENIEEACRKAVKFLNCGEEAEESLDAETAEDVQRLYSFEKDGKYIYSAILQSHGIDLENTEYLHWWKFSWLFLDLREDCFFTKLIYYRRQRLLGRLTKEEQQYCKSIAHLLDLPQQYTQEEMEAENEFMKLVQKGRTALADDKHREL